MTTAKQQRLKNTILIHAGLFLGGLLMCFPFFWMVLTSLKSSSEVLDVDRWLPQQKAYYTEKTTGLNYEVIVLKVDNELVQVIKQIKTKAMK